MCGIAVARALIQTDIIHPSAACANAIEVSCIHRESDGCRALIIQPVGDAPEYNVCDVANEWVMGVNHTMATMA